MTNLPESEPTPDALIATMVKALVSTPQAVRVSAEAGEETGETNYVVYVAPGEAGQIIGKAGKLGNAVRILAKAYAKKHQRAILVHFDAPHKESIEAADFEA